MNPPTNIQRNRGEDPPEDDAYATTKGGWTHGPSHRARAESLGDAARARCGAHVRAKLGG